MKYTMRDKICKLIGKYESKEQEFRARTAMDSIASAIGAKPDADVTSTATKGVMCAVFLDDLKQLLNDDEPEDNSIPSNLPFCRCSGEDTCKKEDNKHE